MNQRVFLCSLIYRYIEALTFTFEFLSPPGPSMTCVLGCYAKSDESCLLHSYSSHPLPSSGAYFKVLALLGVTLIVTDGSVELASICEVYGTFPSLSVIE